jgi:hypothetical protein
MQRTASILGLRLQLPRGVTPKIILLALHSGLISPEIADRIDVEGE